MENRYATGKIYRLLCEDSHYYIGSTIQPLNYRFNNHKKLSEEGVNKVYEYINDIGWDNVTIELIEEYPCHTKRELNIREKYHISQAKNDKMCLNFNEINIYKNGKIYRLQCNDGHYYIGSTTQKLMRRLYHHKETSKKDNTIAYQHIKQLGWKNVEIQLIEDYPCDVKKDLNEREDYYIRQSKDDPLCLNEKRAYVSTEEKKQQVIEYAKNHREDAIQRTKKYREEHQEEVLEKKREYREKNRKLLNEKQKEYAKVHAEQVKKTNNEYYQTHKNEYREYYKDYNEKNKEKIREYKRAWVEKKKEENADHIQLEREEKKKKRQKKTEERLKRDNEIHTCECGGTYQSYRKQRHNTNKKHMNYIASLNRTQENPTP